MSEKIVINSATGEQQRIKSSGTESGTNQGRRYLLYLQTFAITRSDGHLDASFFRDDMDLDDHMAICVGVLDGARTPRAVRVLTLDQLTERIGELKLTMDERRAR